MRKEELLRLCGSIEQLAFARPISFTDGEAEGLKAVLVRCGELEYALMPSKCLDPAWLSYRGINLSFLTKGGLRAANALDTDPMQASRSIMGGAMMTCGFENIHGYMELEGKGYPTHGRMRSTPAAKLCTDAAFNGEDYTVSVSGEMREAEIFGENLVLRRRVESTLGENSILFTDEIENQAFRDEPLCFLYHWNFGYPLLAPGARLIMPSLECIPRDADAAAGDDCWHIMGNPRDNAPEQVFLHRMASDKDGLTFAALANDERELAVCLEWNVNEIPLVTQWKSEASGDYVMAVEPCNTDFRQRMAPGHILPSLGRHINHLRVSVHEGREAICALEERRSKLLE